MELLAVFEKLALALGLGLLVGMQRERVRSQLAGIRTYALITVLGAVCGLLGVEFGGWIVALGTLAVAALLVAGNLSQPVAKKADPGLTTEVAALLMYGIGAYVVIGHAAVAIALGGGTALLLYWKAPLHQFVARIGKTDIKAIMQFVLIALVIWPVLPNQAFGPYGVLNPSKIWFMVVLIVGISLCGYVVQKWLGTETGSVIGGALGGLISSTATTVSYSRRAQERSAPIRLLALVLMIATTIAGARVLLEIAVVAPGAFTQMAPPLAMFLGGMAVLSAAIYFLAQQEEFRLQPPGNPAELPSALVFGALYAAVILGVAAAKDLLGDRGLYGVAVLSGLHDLDAITLSTSQLVDEQSLAPDVGWRLILVASLSNLAVKIGIVAALGERRLLRWMTLLFGAAMVGGILLLLVWPRVE